MQILVAHTHYRNPGGEDAVFEAEIELLRRRGHAVVDLQEWNRRIDSASPVAVAAASVWNRRWHRRIADVLARSSFDVAHFHNTFPLMSPSVYSACRRRGVAVVQTLHNFRLVCPSATLFRSDRICTDCVGRRVPWPAVVHRCYRGSAMESAGVAAMLTVHRLRRTFAREVDLFVAVSEFQRQRLIDGGLAPERIAVKPNFVEPPARLRDGPGDEITFIGRLSAEKGISTLAAACRSLPDVPFRVIGDGPLAAELSAATMPNVRATGWVARDEVDRALARSRCVVLPSLCYEGFPRVVVEAFAHGVPVIASDLGGLSEIVDDGRTGFLVEPRDAAALASKIACLWSHPEESLRMGEAARAEYAAKYDPDRNHALLMAIYSRARGGRP